LTQNNKASAVGKKKQTRTRPTNFPGKKAQTHKKKHCRVARGNFKQEGGVLDTLVSRGGVEKKKDGSLPWLSTPVHILLLRSGKEKNKKPRCSVISGEGGGVGQIQEGRRLVRNNSLRGH